MGIVIPVIGNETAEREYLILPGLYQIYILLT